MKIVSFLILGNNPDVYDPTQPTEEDSNVKAEPVDIKEEKMETAETNPDSLSEAQQQTEAEQVVIGIDICLP